MKSNEPKPADPPLPSRVPGPLPLEPSFREAWADNPELLAFLRTIADGPDDDLPRLVFADWLEEHDAGERAELVRLQVALDSQPGSKRRAADILRAQQLQTAVGWAGAPRGVRLCRGLYTWFNLTATSQQAWNRKNKAPETVESVIRHLDQILEVIDLQQLEISLPLTPAELRLVVGSSALTGVTRLSLSWESFGPNGARALSECPPPPHLTALDLWNCGIQSAGAGHLARSLWPARLVSLNLGRNAIGDIGARAIGDGPFSKLTHLDLMFNGITAGGAKAIAESSRFVGLKRLNVFGNEIGDAGAKHLAGAEWATRMSEFDLRGNPLTPTGVRAILKSCPVALT